MQLGCIGLHQEGGLPGSQEVNQTLIQMVQNPSILLHSNWLQTPQMDKSETMRYYHHFLATRREIPAPLYDEHVQFVHQFKGGDYCWPKQ